MSKIGIVSLVIFGLLVICLFTCNPKYIPIGSEGLLIKLTGENRGIQKASIQPGFVFVSVMNEKLIKMPIQTRSYPFTADSRPGSPNNEAVVAGDKNGTQLIINWALDGSIISGKPSVIYKKYMQTFETLLHGVIRQKGEKGWTQYCRKMDISDILGAGGSALLDSMTNYMNREMEFIDIDGVPEKVFEWERIYFVSSPTPVSPDVTESINKITSARNNYLAKITNARADSAEKVIAANSIDAANKIISRSLTPLLVDYTRAVNWRPLAMGSGSTLMLAPVTK